MNMLGPLWQGVDINLKHKFKNRNLQRETEFHVNADLKSRDAMA